VTTAAPPPGADRKPNIINFEGFDFKRWNAKGSLAWHRSDFEQLPLSLHVVNGSADLEMLEVTNAEMMAFSGPGIAVSVNTMCAVIPAGTGS
jgi:hypothetical protein